MNDYKFILEPYSGISSRYTCNECGKLNNFSRYIDTETGEQLPAHVGRCNSEISCGYHYTPKQHFEESGISPDQEFTPPKAMKKQQRTPKPISFIPTGIFKKSCDGYQENNFIKYLISLFGEEVTSQLIGRYFIGTSKHWPGATVYWQIDAQGKIRTGKIMLYSPTTGKRIKEPYNHFTWTHKALNLPEFNLKQCFFGEHLLKDKTKPVAIVESEKTAIIASQYLPQFIWLATGGLQNLSSHRCIVLNGRKVILYPDLNAFEKWKEKAGRITGLASLTISDLLERKATEAEKEQGLDLADYLIRYDYKGFIQPEPNEPEEEVTHIKQIDKIPPVPSGNCGKHGNNDQRKLEEPFSFQTEEPAESELKNKPDQERHLNSAPESITFEIEELESFFSSFIPSGNPVKLDAAMTVTDLPQFIRSHLATIKANQGRRSFKPYYDRLQLLKEAINKPRNN